MPDAHAVGARIRRARKLMRLTQAELAVKVGVTRNTVDSWENSRAYPKRYDVVLEEVLGISLDDSGSQPPPGPFDDLYPLQENWEELFLADPALSDETKRQWIIDSRVARERQEARKQARRARMDPSLRDPGRAAG